MWRLIRVLFLCPESFVSVAGVGMSGQILVIIALSVIENRASRPGPFEREIVKCC